MNLAQLLADMDDKPRSRTSQILPEAAIERLKEFAALYNAPNPYKPGDFVAPRPSSGISGVGDPHIVTRVNESGFHAGSAEYGQNGTAEIKQIEIACFVGGNIRTFVVHHSSVEPYNPS